MPATARLRFEVLRRDNHTCRYCGRSAPAVKLTVDAVVPEALGGSHKDPANLVTACAECNSGKASVQPDAPLVADVEQDALRWARARQVARDEMLGDWIGREISRDRAEVDEAWTKWKIDGQPLPRLPDWKQAVDRFLAEGLDSEVLGECIELAMGRVARRSLPPASAWQYMCGIAWNKIRELDKRTRELLDGAEPR
jgi:hypothetical protein